MFSLSSSPISVSSRAKTLPCRKLKPRLLQLEVGEGDVDLLVGDREAHVDGDTGGVAERRVIHHLRHNQIVKQCYGLYMSGWPELWTPTERVHSQPSLYAVSIIAMA